MKMIAFYPSIHPPGMGIINALDTIAYVIGLLLGLLAGVKVC